MIHYLTSAQYLQSRCLPGSSQTQDLRPDPGHVQVQVHILKGFIGTGSGPALMQRVLGPISTVFHTQMDPKGKSLYLTINIVQYQSNVVVLSCKVCNLCTGVDSYKQISASVDRRWH